MIFSRTGAIFEKWRIYTQALVYSETKIHRSSEVELKTMSANENQRILYTVFENEIQLPILDITHPLFNASIDEQAYHLSYLKSARSIESLKKMPGFIRKIFVRMSNVDNSYLSGMRTLLYKLGPNLSRGITLSFRDKWAVKQTSFMGLRI